MIASSVSGGLVLMMDCQYFHELDRMCLFALIDFQCTGSSNRCLNLYCVTQIVVNQSNRIREGCPQLASIISKMSREIE